MRHYDIKLLNFLLADFESAGVTAATGVTAAAGGKRSKVGR